MARHCSGWAGAALLALLAAAGARAGETGHYVPGSWSPRDLLAAPAGLFAVATYAAGWLSPVDATFKRYDIPALRHTAPELPRSTPGSRVDGPSLHRGTWTRLPRQGTKNSWSGVSRFSVPRLPQRPNLSRCNFRES